MIQHTSNSYNQMTSIKNNILFKSKRTLQIFTTTLLSLLLPLSFLLLARISTAGYLLSRNLDQFPVAEPPSTVFFSLLSSIPFTPLHVLVSVLCVASLINSLNSRERTGFQFFGSETSGKQQLYTAWIVLCTLQVCAFLTYFLFCVHVGFTLQVGVWV